MFLRFLFTFLLGICFSLLGAQVLDDSTQQVYGPSTTRYFMEDDIFHNRADTLRPDTLLHSHEDFTPVPLSSFEWEDLGTSATALRNRYYVLPSQTGATAGFNGYHYFFIEPDEVPYYDTKSPYTNLEIMLGGSGRDFVNVSINRNVNPNWNLGFDVRSIVIRRQIQSPSRRDRWHQSMQYDFHTSYRSPNNKYTLLANFSRTRHQVTETGGTDSATTEKGYFDYDNVQANLLTAKSIELKRQYHLYQEYKFWPLAQIYYKMDRMLQWNDYNDTDVDLNYYRNVFLDSAETKDRMQFNTFRNEVGVKGRYNRLFYNFYYSLRSVEVQYARQDTMQLDFDPTFIENYLGFNLEVPLPGDVNLDFHGEYLQGGRYQISGGIRAYGIEGHFKQMKYAVPILYRQYLGNHDRWSNDFVDPSNTEIHGGYRLKFGESYMKPFVTWQNVTNHVYMASDTLPAQASTAINLLTLGAQWRINFLKHFWFTGQGKYTSISSDSIKAIRIPQLTLNTQVYWQNYVFKGIEFQLGAQVFWQSDYFGYGYRPTVQQYYVQDITEIEAFPRADFFLNVRLGRARLLLKVVNLVHWATDQSYFTAPGYISHNKAIDFGVRWMFFD